MMMSKVHDCISIMSTRKDPSILPQNKSSTSKSSTLASIAMLMLMLLPSSLAFVSAVPSKILSPVRQFDSSRIIQPSSHSAGGRGVQQRKMDMVQLRSQVSNEDEEDALRLEPEEEEEEKEYDVKARLREEAESPFRSFRFFVYGGFAASGAIGAFITLTGALAAAQGVRGATPMSESGKDIAIDLGVILLSAICWQLDAKGKANRLGRLTLGAKIAGLKVQLQDEGLVERPILSLADFRRDRGNARRVIIVAGGEDVVQKALEGALSIKDRLLANAFIVVPVVLGKNPATLGLAQERLKNALDQHHIAPPILLSDWQNYLGTEAAAAKKQGIDPEAQGISIVLKLNGRVGQRAFGVPNWERLVGDVERRRSRGLDVKNI